MLAGPSWLACRTKSWTRSEPPACSPSTTTPRAREPTVEVAHEALIRNWPRLRAWLAEDRDGLRVLRHLSDSAGAWDSRGREPGDLYRGARLAAATDLVSGSPERLTEIEAEFVAASREAADADEHRRRRSTRRLRRFAAGLSISRWCAR